MEDGFRDWAQAGLAVHERLFEDPVLRNNLGWADEVVVAGGSFFHLLSSRNRLNSIPGSIKLHPYPKKGPHYRPPKAWRKSMALRAGNASEFCEGPEKLWFEAKHLVSMKSNVVLDRGCLP